MWPEAAGQRAATKGVGSDDVDIYFDRSAFNLDNQTFLHTAAHEMAHAVCSPEYEKAFGGKKSAATEGVPEWLADQVDPLEEGVQAGYESLRSEVQTAIDKGLIDENVIKRAFFGGSAADIEKMKAAGLG
jgi:hypothetical protein